MDPVDVTILSVFQTFLLFVVCIQPGQCPIDNIKDLAVYLYSNLVALIILFPPSRNENLAGARRS